MIFTYFIVLSFTSSEASTLIKDPCKEEKPLQLIINNGNVKGDISYFASKVHSLNGDALTRCRAGRALARQVLDPHKIIMIMKLAEVVGCDAFIKALHKKKLFKTISDLMRGGSNVAIFCPLNEAFVRNKNHVATLMDHVALKFDESGGTYRTLSGGNIVFNVSKTKVGVTAKANGVEVVAALADAANKEFIITKDVIKTTVYPSVTDVLKEHSHLSIFYNLLQRVQLEKIFTTKRIKHVCFATKTCVSSPLGRIRQFNEMSFNHFTMFVPTNAMFRQIPTSYFKGIVQDKVLLVTLLQQQVFVGSLNTSQLHQMLFSVYPNHFVRSSRDKGSDVVTLTDARGRHVVVKKTLMVKEGTLHVVDTLR